MAAHNKKKKAPGAFRTIGELAEELNVEQHVLRFWESKFSQIKPLKRGGGRRYYRPEDVQVVTHIHDLLHNQGYTIRGAQNVLKGQTRNKIAADHPPANGNTDVTGLTGKQKALLKATLGTLKDMRNRLDDVG